MAKPEKVKAAIPKNLNELSRNINKSHGEGSIVKGIGSIVKVAVFPTNIISIDTALGCNGIPRGRIIEIFGPESHGKTTTALTFAKACQEHSFSDKGRNGVVAFIDAEHALDIDWAKKIGINVEELLISQPDSGEEAFDIVEQLIDSKLVDLIIVDSVAALIPQSMIDGDFHDQSIGKHAQLMSRGLNKIKGKCNKTLTTIIFINQIREKVGVMFGCLHYNTLINFVDGKAIPIGKVVEERIGGNVWAYNEKTLTFDSRPIIDWHYNGDVVKHDDYLSITAIGPGNRNGCMSVTVTPDHLIMTDKWTKASELSIGSQIMTKYNSIMDGQFGQFLYGVLAGDSHICSIPKHLNACLKIRDNIDLEYAEWKTSKLIDLNFKRREYSKNISFESNFFTDFALHKKEFPNRDPMALLENFSWLGMAVWIMDDACYNRDRYTLSIKRFRGDFDKIEQISRAFDKLGLYHYASEGGKITFDKNISNHIAEEICNFVPPCMKRKLPIDLQNRYIDFSLSISPKLKSTYATIIKIRNASDKQMKNKGKYDINVGVDHCYLAGGANNGLLVHNSPETTPGGRALKFFSSIRLEVKRSAAVKEGDVTVGFETNLKVVKNKVGSPFTVASYTICVGTKERPTYGIDAIGNIIDYAIEHKIISRSGSWYSYKETRLGLGMAATIKLLSEHPTFFKEIKAEIYALLPKTVDILIPPIENTEDDIEPENEETE